MTLKGVIFEDFVNYKIPCMTLEFPYCSMKCNKECGQPVCQNGSLADSPNITTQVSSLVKRYLGNQITKAVVMQGMEPFDSWNDLYEFILEFRQCSDDDIVIYTGYTKCEISSYIKELKQFSNIIVKFGRYIPNQKSHYDSVLGIELASDNQYAERIS